MIAESGYPGEMFFMFDACHSEAVGQNLNGLDRVTWHSAVSVNETAADNAWNIDSFTEDWLEATRNRKTDTDLDGKVELSEVMTAATAASAKWNPTKLKGKLHPKSGGGLFAPDQELHDDVGDAMRKLKTDKSLTQAERLKLASFVRKQRIKSIRLANSVDPNEKLGPSGYGAERYIAANEIPYTIYFENDPEKATAAASGCDHHGPTRSES